MGGDIICIDDAFEPDWLEYFRLNGIATPVKDKVYSIRELVEYLHGEKGLLLNEIVNKRVPKRSFITGGMGMAEQAWRITRFSTLEGKTLTIEMVREIVKQTKVENHGVT